MPSETPLPARLDAEPAIWYRRFVAWLQGGPTRSVLAVSNAERELARKKTQDSPPGGWMEKTVLYRWKERAAEWDKAEAERLNIELAERREAWRKTEENMAAALVLKGREILTGKAPEKVNPKTNKPYTSSEVAAMFDAGKVRAATACFDAASTIARRALEIPPVIRQEITGRDGEPVEVNYRDAILRRLGEGEPNSAGETKDADA